MLETDTPALIELAIAPVFLLVAIGNLLNVLTARLARVVDRSRLVAQEVETAAEPIPSALHDELVALDKRMRFVNLAIFASCLALLLVCVMVMALFVGGLTMVSTGPLVPGLFIASMLSLSVGALLFLVEVRVATASLKIPRHLLIK